MGQRALYCGEFACAKRALLTLRSPMDRGAVQDWHDEQAMWHNIFYDELRVATADAPVLVTETLFTPKKDRYDTQLVNWLHRFMISHYL